MADGRTVRAGLRRRSGEPTFKEREPTVKMRGFNLVAMLLVAAIVMLLCFVATVKADEYQRVVFMNAKAGSFTNTAAFYNAKLLMVRAKNVVASKTNTVTFTQITSDHFTNSLASVTSTTAVAQKNVETNDFVILRNDVVSYSATTNANVEFILDNRSR